MRTLHNTSNHFHPTLVIFSHVKLWLTFCSLLYICSTQLLIDSYFLNPSFTLSLLLSSQFYQNTISFSMNKSSCGVCILRELPHKYITTNFQIYLYALYSRYVLTELYICPQVTCKWSNNNCLPHENLPGPYAVIWQFFARTHDVALELYHNWL